jgi:flavin-binding protein dodecin
VGESEEAIMVEKTIELTATSSSSIEEAVNVAVARAAVTIQNIRRFRVKEIRGVIENGTVTQWQVTIDLSFVVAERIHE